MDPVRSIEHAYEIYSADEMLTIGLGETELTVKHGDGLGTRTVVKAFRLVPDQCIVTKHSEIGGVCAFCLQETVERQPALSLRRAALLSSVCTRHYVTCAYPYCGQGLCSTRHAAQIPGVPGFLCRPHFLEIGHDLDLHHVRQTRGDAAAAWKGFWDSLFE